MHVIPPPRKSLPFTPKMLCNPHPESEVHLCSRHLSVESLPFKQRECEERDECAPPTIRCGFARGVELVDVHSVDAALNRCQFDRALVDAVARERQLSRQRASLWKVVMPERR
ncbi:hypothetical protein QFZ89_004026 [Paraburkholderia youngii]